MTTSELKARALYDFVAEVEGELTVAQHEILVLLETPNDNPWWSARNSFGQKGVVPSNYVEIIQDEPIQTQQIPAEQERDQSLDIFTPETQQKPAEQIQNLDIFTFDTDHSNSQSVPQVDNTTLTHNEQEVFGTAPLNVDWKTDSAGNFYEDPDLLNEQDPSTDSSFDSYGRTANNETTTDFMSMTLNSANPFTSNVNSSTPPDLFSMNDSNSMQQPNDTYYPSYEHVFTPIERTPPVSQSIPPSTFNPVASFPYVQPKAVEQPSNQLVTSLDNFNFPPPATQQVRQSDSNYDVTSPMSSLNQPTTMTSQPINNPPPPPTPAENRNTNQTVASKPSSEAKVEEPVQPKVKPRSKYFTLKRQKTKSDGEKRLSFGEPSSDPAAKQVNGENNVNSSAASGQPLQSTLSSSSKTPSGEVEAKGPPRARFFDKYGIDNYLLHGFKTKSDEKVEIGFDEKEGVHWIINPIMRPFSCKVEEPSKGTKLGGLKTFMEYKIHPEIPDSRAVGRRYKQFDWLHEQLVTKFRFICIPPLPGKQISGRFEQEFIEERRRQLEIWLNRICRHPVLCASYPVQHFVTCELTDGNNKDWKTGKRQIEKDDLRGASWLHCISYTNSNLSDSDLAAQIDSFAQKQPSLEVQIRNLSQGLMKYLERQTEVYERDLERLSELFAKFQKVLQTDTTTLGNQELSESTLKISTSYYAVAELYKTKASEGIRDFNERIQEYIGLLACFPSIIHIQKSAAEFMKSLQQRSPTTTPDFSLIANRNNALHHVVAAEINFFQKEKVKDLHLQMKTLMNEQIEFYEKVTAELREAALTFS